METIPTYKDHVSREVKMDRRERFNFVDKDASSRSWTENVEVSESYSNHLQSLVRIAEESEII